MPASPVSVEVEVAPAPVVLEPVELQDMFVQVMHEWGCAPFRRGEVELPTLPELDRVVGRTRYLGPVT